jgi:hypothetical protein
MINDSHQGGRLNKQVDVQAGRNDQARKKYSDDKKIPISFHHSLIPNSPKVRTGDKSLQ